jgi:hypothetical protein
MSIVGVEVEHPVSTSSAAATPVTPKREKDRFLFIFNTLHLI